MEVITSRGIHTNLKYHSIIIPNIFELREEVDRTPTPKKNQFEVYKEMFIFIFSWDGRENQHKLL